MNELSKEFKMFIEISHPDEVLHVERAGVGLASTTVLG
jgi:hypothetical protein